MPKRYIVVVENPELLKTLGNVSEKLLDLLGKGVLAKSQASRMMKEGTVNLDLIRKEILMVEKTRQDVHDFRSGKVAITDDYEIVPIASDHPYALRFPDQAEWDGTDQTIQAIARLSEAETKIKELERTINLSEIGLYAVEYTKIKAEEGRIYDGKTQEVVDPTWFNRWRLYAQDVQTEDLKRLWAKVISEENIVPGSYSLHTVELLSRLSKHEAEEIAKASRFIISGIFLREKFLPKERPDAELREYCEVFGINQSFLHHLETLGILEGVSGGGITKTIDPLESEQFQLFLQYGLSEEPILGFFFTKKGEPKAYELGGYRISRLGKEIFKLAETENELAHLEAFAKYFLTIYELDEVLFLEVPMQSGEYRVVETFKSGDYLMP